jgi:hypothetical protein
MYDLLIVGAGIAGLHLGIEWLKRGKTCCIIEASKHSGGRVATYHKETLKGSLLQWEEGAGRIALSHHRVLSLLKRYHLHTAPLPPHTTLFYELYDTLIQPLSLLPSHIVTTHTMGELLLRVHGGDASVPTPLSRRKSHIQRILQSFPYWSEIHLQRADVSLKAFASSMGGAESFVVCTEGLSAMIEGMEAEFVTRGGVIQHEMKAVHVQKGSVDCLLRHQTEKRIEAKQVVLALSHGSLLRLYQRSHVTDPLLRHIAMAPLIRMYAVFDTDVSAMIPYSIFPNRIRYVIPISSYVVMISYTDGADAAYWAKQIKLHGEKAVVKMVMQELRETLNIPARILRNALRSALRIPDPIDFKIHHWSEGCSYWLPGTYSVKEVSQRLLRSPLPSVYVCGESYAEEPCWMESALIQAEKLLHIL